MNEEQRNDVDGWKVYSDEDVQDFVARSVEEATTFAQLEYGVEGDLFELSAADLDRKKFLDEDGETERVITYRERLVEVVASLTGPEYFAGEM